MTGYNRSTSDMTRVAIVYASMLASVRDGNTVDRSERIIADSGTAMIRFS
jgi:hypothetical protein